MRRSLEVIREEPVWFATAAVRRLGPMLAYGVGGAEWVKPVQRDGAIHEQAGPRTSLDDRLLEPGRLASPLRGTVRGLQRALAASTPGLAFCGLTALVLVAPRRLGLLLLIPLYHLTTQAPLHFEPRFILPMHPFVLALAATGLAVLLSAGARLSRLARRRGELGARSAATEAEDDRRVDLVGLDLGPTLLGHPIPIRIAATLADVGHIEQETRGARAPRPR